MYQNSSKRNEKCKKFTFKNQSSKFKSQKFKTQSSKFKIQKPICIHHLSSVFFLPSVSMTSRSHLIVAVICWHAFAVLVAPYYAYAPESGLQVFIAYLPFALFGALILDLDAEQSRIKNLGLFALPKIRPKNWWQRVLYAPFRDIYNPVVSFINTPFAGLSRMIHVVCGHRKFFHSIPLWILFGALLVVPAMNSILWAFYIGLISHLLADSTTKAGVPLVPLSVNPKKSWYNVGIGPKFLRMRTGSNYEYLFVFGGTVLYTLFSFST